MIENIYQKEKYFYKKYSQIVDLFTGKTISAVYKCTQEYSYDDTWPEDDLPDYDGLCVFEIENKKYAVYSRYKDDGHTVFDVKEIDSLDVFKDGECSYEIEDGEKAYVALSWQKINFVYPGAVQMVVPFYDDFSERVCGFTLVFKEHTYSFETFRDSESVVVFEIYEDAPCPKYIYRKKSRAMFTAMFDFVNEETERLKLRKLSGLRFALECKANMSTNKYVRSLYGVNKLGLSYSPNPSISEISQIIVETHVEAIACPPEYVERFCELVCADNPKCFRCPIKEYCNQGKIYQ